MAAPAGDVAPAPAPAVDEDPKLKFPPPDYPKAPPFPNLHMVYYSPVFKDDLFEYKYMVLPEASRMKLYEIIDASHGDHHLLTMPEMTDLGAYIDSGWQHCLIWRPPRQHPTVLVRRSLNVEPDNYMDPTEMEPDPAFVPIPALDTSGVPILKLNNTPDIKAYHEGIENVFDALKNLTNKPQGSNQGMDVGERIDEDEIESAEDLLRGLDAKDWEPWDGDS